jgi:phosphoribosyl 1,2-cyclic phosphodiesterase
MAGAGLSVTFWGVRGSIACGGPDTVRYGGNTSCLEVRAGDRLMIFDAGTGLRYLGHKLMGETPLDTDLFLTHTHFDHVCGLPFFTPFFDSRNTFRVHSGHLYPAMGTEDALCGLMMAPLFPVPLSIFHAKLSFHDFCAGETHDMGPDVKIRTAPLNHPNGATGYRIDHAGTSICYLTDTEHPASGLDQNILGLIDGADLVIYDSMYTPAQYEARRGWGHSTWQAGAALCDAAKAKTLVIFHHDPDHDDAFMDRLAAEAEVARPGTIVAREGMTLHA